MLQPSRVKYRKPQRGVIRGIAVRRLSSQDILIPDRLNLHVEP